MPQVLRAIVAKKEAGAARLSEVRNDFEESLSCLNFAGKLWVLFKALIAGALTQMACLTSTAKDGVLSKIDQTVIDFFTQVLQMDSFTLRQETLE
jgi:hypothetical protein